MAGDKPKPNVKKRGNCPGSNRLVMGYYTGFTCEYCGKKIPVMRRKGVIFGVMKKHRM